MKKMIEPTSLRLGNKVRLNGADLTVKAIEFNSVNQEYFIRVFEDFRAIQISYIEPIPLTEELLLRFGFNKHQDFWLKGKVQLAYITTDEHFEFEYSCPDVAWTLVDIKYAHTLQNIYYLLENQELKLEGL